MEIIDPNTIFAADLFCGAGGMSRGFLRACELLGLPVKLVAINHWRRAIDVHRKNHPGVAHLCESLDSVNPLDVLRRLFAGTGVPESRMWLDLLIAAPECRFFSKARGGKPVREQPRVSPWVILRWLEAIPGGVRFLLCENVREMMDWGPLDEEGRPIAARKGETFDAFMAALRALGYSAEFRVLNAASYGAATRRLRLFIVARRGEGVIPWPLPTHGAHLIPERTAREIIEWDDPGVSIFNRDLHGLQPLTDKTQRRAFFGIVRNNGLCLVPQFGERKGQAPRAHSVDRPVPTVTSRGAGAVARASLHRVRRPGAAPAGPHLVRAGEPGGPHLVEDAPLPVSGEELSAVVAGVLGALELPLAEPVPLDAFLISYHGSHKGKADGDRRVRTLDEPLPTVDTSNRYALISPVLVSYEDFKRRGAERRGIFIPELDLILDIHYRMLSVRELARAQGFGDEFEFEGNQGDQLRMVGNAVPVELAFALCRAILERHAAERGIETRRTRHELSAAAEPESVAA